MLGARQTNLQQEGGERTGSLDFNWHLSLLELFWHRGLLGLFFRLDFFNSFPLSEARPPHHKTSGARMPTRRISYAIPSPFTDLACASRRSTPAPQSSFSWFRNYAPILSECSGLRHSKPTRLNSHTGGKRGKAMKKNRDACTKSLCQVGLARRPCCAKRVVLHPSFVTGTLRLLNLSDRLLLQQKYATSKRRLRGVPLPIAPLHSLCARHDVL